MSFFVPLNVYEEDIVQDAEQHTRELQIEEALELYRTALEYQRDKNTQEAHKAYQKLFNIEVLKLTYSTGLPPAAEKLKFLAYKNYSLLLLHELHVESSTISRDDLVDRIGTILDWVSDALEYNSDDAAFLDIVRLISMPLGYYRIARLALECICYLPEKTVALDQEFISAKGIVGPQDSQTLVRLKEIVTALGDTTSLNQHKVFDLLKHAELPEWLERSDAAYSWLTSRKDIADDLSNLMRVESTTRTMDITISSVNWTSIGTVLLEALMSISKGRKKSILDDSYIYSVNPVNSVKFILPHGETILIDGEPSTLPDQSMDIDTSVQEAGEDSDVVVVEDPNKSKKRRAELIDIPARSSKRVKARSDVQTLDYSDMTVDEAFFDQLNSFIAHAGLKFSSVVHIFRDDEFSDQDQYIHDFKVLLQCWDDEQAEMYFRGENTSQQQGPSSLSQALDFAALGDATQSRTMPVDYTGLANQFIYMINSGNYSLQDVRMRFVCAVLRSYRQESREFETKASLHVLSDKIIESEKLSILYDIWPTALLANLSKILVELDGLFYADAKRTLFSNDDSQLLFQLSLAESIFEMTVEKFLELNKSVPSWERNKKEMNENILIKERYQNRIQSWYRLIRDLASLYKGPLTEEVTIISLRCDWIHIFYQQANDSSPEDSLCAYRAIQERQKREPGLQHRDIPFTNFSHIPQLSTESITTQISKVQATAVFAKVLDNSGAIDEIERAKMLEAILIPEEQEVNIPEHEAISQFMSFSSSEFKMRLWYTLLEIYSHVGETTKSFDGFLRIFVSAVSELTSEEYQNSDEHFRQFTIIKTLHVCSDVSKNILRLLDENGEKVLDNLSPARLRDTIDKIGGFLRMLHVYIFVADAITNNVMRAPSHLSWEKLATQIRDNIIRSWSLFYILFKRILPEAEKHPDILNDILSIVHEAIGMRGFCGSADGYLLELSLREFVRMDWNESEADLLQCLHCRYGLGLGNEHFIPVNHHCTPGVLMKSVPFSTSKFIIRMVMRKKNLTQSLLRTEVKNVLDQFYEVVGVPNKREFPFGHNFGVLDRYLSKPITGQLIRDCIRGRLNLSFVDSKSDYMNFGKTGFYYAFGQAQYALFKIRNKSSSQELTSDLQECIQLFCSDLVCNTDRFESWLMIAKTIDSLAADDLTWTAEKLNDPEKRKEIASLQRRSILACIMAINVHVQNVQSGNKAILTNIHYQQQASTLWSTFSKFLYNASRPPMNMGAFEDIPARLFFGSDGTYTKPLVAPLSRMTVTLVVQKMLHKAIQAAPSDWYNYYMLAKVLWNIRAPVDTVLQTILQAVEYAPDKNTSHTEIAVEAHYKMVSLLYKYVRRGQLSADKGLEFLQRSFLFGGSQDLENTGTVEAQFYASLVATLYKIRAADKKRWQHRPTFRIAKILDEVYNKKNQAFEEMSTLFTLRNNHRSAVMIWKPDLERPGEHYTFVFQYTMYFVDILSDLNDADSLMILAKKLRKFQSGMVNHHQAWEHLCTSVSAAIKRILFIDPKFNDIIPSLIFDEFEENTLKLTHLVERGQLVPKLLGWLNYAQEFRKLNNSIGSTAALDDLFVAIYLNIYYPSLPQLEKSQVTKATVETPGTPSKKSTNWVSPQTPHNKSDGEIPKSSPGNATGTKARVTRRDITARGTALIRAIPENVREQLMPKIAEVKGNNKQANGASKPAGGITVTIPNPSRASTPSKDVQMVSNTHSDSDTDIEILEG